MPCVCLSVLRIMTVIFVAPVRACLSVRFEDNDCPFVASVRVCLSVLRIKTVLLSPPCVSVCPF